MDGSNDWHMAVCIIYDEADRRMETGRDVRSISLFLFDVVLLFFFLTKLVYTMDIVLV